MQAGPTIGTFLETGDRYAVVCNLDRSGTIWHLEPDGVTWNSVDASTVASNSLALPFDDDNHNYPAMIPDQANRLIVVGNMHHQAMRAIRSDVAASVLGGFSDISSEFETFADDVYTYPQFSVTSTGIIFLQFRRRDNVPPSDFARNALFRSTAAGDWEDLGDWVKGTAGSVWHGYMGAINIDPRDDVLRAAGAWALSDTALSRETPFYMESHDLGETWENVEGDALTTPLTFALAASQGASLGYAPGGGFNPVNGVCLNQIGDPVVVLGNILGGTSRATWNGSSWAGSSPTAQTGISGDHIPFNYDNELWYLTTGLHGIPTIVRRDGLVKAGMSPRFNGRLTQTIDLNALRGGLVQTLAFELDGETPMFRNFGHGLTFETP